MKIESVEEFLSRGGKIERVEYDRSYERKVNFKKDFRMVRNKISKNALLRKVKDESKRVY